MYSSQQLNALVSRLVLVFSLVGLGGYLALVTWYWVLPDRVEVVVDSDQQLKPDVVLKDQLITLSAVLASLSYYNPWGEIPRNRPAKKKKIVKKQVERTVASKLNVELLGTMVQKGKQSVAFVVEATVGRVKRGRSKQKMLYVGDEIQGAKLENIERNAIYLRNGSQLEVVELESELFKNEDLFPKREKVEEYRGKQIGREEWVEAIDKKNDILSGLEVIPFYQGRDSVGYRINIVDPRPIYKKFGVFSGDIIKSINGVSVMGSQEFLSTLSKLKQADKIEIEVMRKRKPETLILYVRD